ncbi:unnamed protein product [Gemmata massiliana]|uniref:Uncharacterized protein n=1 Tax=Gemmata massiliana TaxID=1210884 RepID=A0A6P2DFT8_9BACT|nr:hypothetical protein [Gemmata massiliana]VTS01384.1 unnamed protein product [Gemmata massiliana]
MWKSVGGGLVVGVILTASSVEFGFRGPELVEPGEAYTRVHGLTLYSYPIPPGPQLAEELHSPAVKWYPPLTALSAILASGVVGGLVGLGWWRLRRNA